MGPVGCGGDRPVGAADPAASSPVLLLPVYSQLFPGCLERVHRGDHRILPRLHLTVRPLERRRFCGVPVRVLPRGWENRRSPVHPRDARVRSCMFGWFWCWLPAGWHLLICAHFTVIPGQRHTAANDELPVYRLKEIKSISLHFLNLMMFKV